METNREEPLLSVPEGRQPLKNDVERLFRIEGCTYQIIGSGSPVKLQLILDDVVDGGTGVYLFEMTVAQRRSGWWKIEGSPIFAAPSSRKGVDEETLQQLQELYLHEVTLETMFGIRDKLREYRKEIKNPKPQVETPPAAPQQVRHIPAVFGDAANALRLRVSKLFGKPKKEEARKATTRVG